MGVKINRFVPVLFSKMSHSYLYHHPCSLLNCANHVSVVSSRIEGGVQQKLGEKSSNATEIHLHSNHILNQNHKASIQVHVKAIFYFLWPFISTLKCSTSFKAGHSIEKMCTIIIFFSMVDVTASDLVLREDISDSEDNHAEKDTQSSSQ